MSNPNVTLERLDLKAGLKAWAEQKEISITRFADDMKYIYQHAWNILNGSAPVTFEVVGRFALAYGSKAIRELFELSGMPNGEPETQGQS